MLGISELTARLADELQVQLVKSARTKFATQFAWFQSVAEFALTCAVLVYSDSLYILIPCILTLVQQCDYLAV